MEASVVQVSGEARAPSGATNVPIRSGPYREQIVYDVGLGRLFEAARNGRIFHQVRTALTIAATHNSPLAAATATPIVGVFNPSSSAKAAVILRGWFSSISGTPPASAQPTWNFATAIGTLSTNPTGAAIPAVIGQAQASAMKLYNGVALTALGVATGQVGEIRHFGGAVVAGALAANGFTPCEDNTDGSIIVPPGTACMMLAGSAAGTSWVVAAGMTWAEVDWPLN